MSFLCIPIPGAWRIHRHQLMYIPYIAQFSIPLKPRYSQHASYSISNSLKAKAQGIKCTRYIYTNPNPKFKTPTTTLPTPPTPQRTRPTTPRTRYTPPLGHPHVVEAAASAGAPARTGRGGRRAQRARGGGLIGVGCRGSGKTRKMG